MVGVESTRMDDYLRPKMTRFTARVVDVAIGLIEAILVLRFVLALLGANPYAGFSRWVYSTSDPLMQPFAGIFPSVGLGGGYVADFSTLFAIIVYALIGWLLTKLLSFATAPNY